MKNKCINPQCANEQHSRGLCMGCYRTAKNLMDNDTFTEQQLIDAGKILEPYVGRKSKWFLEGVENED